ncbi:hypothetical protein JG687_00016773, partial [Phytophthora cactorum]
TLHSTGSVSTTYRRKGSRGTCRTTGLSASNDQIAKSSTGYSGVGDEHAGAAHGFNGEGSG